MDRRRPLSALLSLLSILALGSSSAVQPRQEQREALRTIESKEGRFRVELPDSLPAPAKKSRSTVLGDVHETHYVVDWGEASVSIELYDIPRLATLLFPSRFMLDRAANGVVADMDAREIDRTNLRRQDRPARVVTYELPGKPIAVERALIVLAESRLYVVVVTGSPGDALDPALERVIDSFEIIP